MKQSNIFRFWEKYKIICITILIIIIIISIRIIIGHRDKVHVKILQVKDENVSAQVVGAINQDNTITPLSSTSNNKPNISVYTVVAGDTLSGIAKKFSVSENTIRWANNLNKKDTIHIGESLTILPITGIEYKVEKNDTLSGIAKNFNTDENDIANFNQIDNTDTLKVGMSIIIPDAEPININHTKKLIPGSINNENQENSGKTQPSTPINPVVSSIEAGKSSGYFIQPIPGSILTQGLHGYDAVDFGAPVGTPVRAAAAGTVIVAKGNDEYNGGYGNYIVIQHNNGSQTLYAHLSVVSVIDGEQVAQGQNIALSGKSGRVTGPHLHFEVRGAINPWIYDAIGTHY